LLGYGTTLRSDSVLDFLILSPRSKAGVNVMEPLKNEGGKALASLNAAKKAVFTRSKCAFLPHSTTPGRVRWFFRGSLGEISQYRVLMGETNGYIRIHSHMALHTYAGNMRLGMQPKATSGF
jgi:hypothetical protein